MSRLIVSAFTLSIDGYGAGPGQDEEQPLGRGGERLHEWMTPTRAFHEAHGTSGGATGIDDEFAARGFDAGAWILGRNMFGPVRGLWPDESWRGWWGENPPFHVPTFVLTHHARPSLEMEGGTVFHFVTGGIHDALDQAREAASGRDVRLGGGASIIRQYLQAGLVDEMHLAIAPVLLGQGEPLLTGIDLLAAGFAVTEHAPSARATHFVLTRQKTRKPA